MAFTSSKKLSAAVIAAVTLAGIAIGSTAIASAAPEWDIERYDDCMKGVNHPDPSEQLAWTRKCCLDSGGVWNDSLGRCQSPPAQPAQGPGVAPRPGMIIHTFEPMPPTVIRNPGVITQTLAPESFG
jgi:hypothetical protein